MSDLHFVDYDAAAIEQRALEVLETALDEPLSLSDERRIFLQAVIQVLVSSYATLDNTARQNLLRYARGEVLDEIGYSRGVSRLPAEFASTTFRFALSAVQPQNITIPKGTRVTSDGVILFATVADLVINTGTFSGEVQGISTVPAAAANGLLPGAVSALVDPLPYVATIANITTTAGGSDIETDDSFRERIQQAPAFYSVAGPSAAYEYFARSASPGVQDVTATSAGPGEVLVSVLVRNGYDLGSVLEAVSAAVNDRTIRPLTDHVTVAEAVAVPFDIDIVYYAPSFTESQVVQAIEGDGGALDQYIDWQTSRIERNINPDQMLMMLVQAGALKVDITSPTYVELSSGQVAKLNTRTVSHQILEVDGR